MVAGCQYHATDTGVQWKHGQFMSDRSHPVKLVKRSQFLQKLISVGNGSFQWWFHERKRVDVSQFQGFHPQNDGRKRRPENLGSCIGLSE